MKASPRQMAHFVEEHLEIPAIPEVVGRALRAMDDPNVDGVQLSKIIARDPGLTTQILRIANSASFGLRRKVQGLEQAAVLLGFKAIRQLVISASCWKLYKRFGWVEQRLWLHGIAVAAAANLIAKRAEVAGREQAFIAGLMHDIGKVVMNNAAPDEYRAVLERQDAGGTSESAEREIYGFTHSEVGSLLVAKWELTAELESAVLLHHDPDFAASLDDVPTDLVYTLAAADLLVHRLGLVDDTEIGPLDDVELFANLGLDPDDLPALAEETRQAFEADRSLYG